MPFYYWLIAIPVLAVLILIHEIGHFWAARWMKVRIDEFGIGFPPRILTLWEHNGVKYTLNWILIGGFVRLAGEDDPKVEGGLASKKPWQRTIVLVAGALMNLLLAFLLFTGLAMYGRTEVVSRQVGISWVEPDSPAAAAKLQPGDFITAINGRQVTSADDLRIEITLNRGYTITLGLERDGQPFTVRVYARKEPPKDQGPTGIRLAYYEAPVTVQWVTEGSPAAQAGLGSGDVIAALDGQPIRNSLEYESFAARHSGQNVTVTVQRDGKDLAPIVLPVGDATQELPMGISYLRVAFTTYPLGYGLAEGWRETIDAGLLVPRTLAALFRNSVPVSDLSGPLGISYAAAEVARQAGFYGLLRLMAVISINLGLVNLLPLPALDGGRLVFVLVEWIRRGKRIAPEKEGLVHLIGFILFLVFAAVVAYFDIIRVASGSLGGP